MMTIATAPQITDQRIVLSGRSWEQFKLIQQGLEDSPGTRLFYYDGTIEILMPGREHEVFKSIIALLLGIYFEEHGIEFEPTGSMTQEREGTASAQADESYCIGISKPVPDLSIELCSHYVNEVIFTSGGPSKLQRYQALGVPEVWFFEVWGTDKDVSHVSQTSKQQDGVFTLYRLRGNGYDRLNRSEIPELAKLDVELLTRCVLLGETSRLEAMREFRKGIQGR